MKILKALGLVVLALVLLVGLVVFGARFSDGPLAIIPGGSLEAGPMHSGPEPDWTFAKDIPELELELVASGVSRTVWLEVVDGKLYLVSGYMNTPQGKLWKQWPHQAAEDPRAVIRVDGKRYERRLVRLDEKHPALPGILSEVSRKYGAAFDPSQAAQAAASGDAWFYAVLPR